VESAEQTEQFELRDYFAILRRRWLTIVVVTVICTGLALAYSLSRQAEYEATASVLLRRTAGQSIAGGGSGSGFDIPTETQVVTSRSVRDLAEAKLGHPVNVSASSGETGTIIQISTQATNADQAVADANGYAKVYIEERRQQSVDDYLQAAEQVQTKIDDINAQIGFAVTVDEQERLARQRDFYANQLDQLRFAASANQIGGAQIVSAAGGANKVRPVPSRDALIGFVGGLILGIALAFLREYLDDSIKNKGDLERASGGVLVIGLIPAVSGWRESTGPRLVSMSHPQAVYTEAYITLRTSLQFLSLDKPIRALQITSPSAGEGKTTTLANLGVVLARAGQRVVIVCCDLRRPRVHDFFGLDNQVGFTSVLLGESPLSAALQPVPGQPGLVVLPSGPPPPNPAELLSTARAAEVLDALRANSDIVLVDSPPILPVADATVLSQLVDATIVVARAGKTSRRSLHRAVEVLQQVDAPLVGTVLNGMKQSSSDGYALAYGYGYGHEEPKKGLRRNGKDAGGDPDDIVLEDDLAD
jgi:capsular exopolysaccharide synthesis family protein